MTCRKIVSGGNWVDPKVGGAMPSFAGTDSEMIAELIAEYGPEGSRYTGGKPAVDDGGIDLSARTADTEWDVGRSIPEPA